MNIALESNLAKLPIMEIQTTIQNHTEPLMEILPDRRMQKVLENMLLGILGGQTPIITGMARQNGKTEGETWAVAKSMYRWLANKRLETTVMYQGLYQVGQKVVEGEKPEYLVVAVDPVNFEKPYTKALEGVSVVHKATPPDLTGHARLAHGYPAITATIVNTQVPVTSYANWFSYQTADFLSQNKEVEQAFETTHRLYLGRKIRFVGDSGLDDQKMFAHVVKLEDEFVFRVSHLERIVEVTMIVSTAGKPKNCKTWWKVFPTKLLSKCCSNTPEKPDATRFILAGSRFGSPAHKTRCGFWWPTMKP